jgi:hypothetical protein
MGETQGRPRPHAKAQQLSKKQGGSWRTALQRGENPLENMRASVERQTQRASSVARANKTSCYGAISASHERRHLRHELQGRRWNSPPIKHCSHACLPGGAGGKGGCGSGGGGLGFRQHTNAAAVSSHASPLHE